MSAVLHAAWILFVDKGKRGGGNGGGGGGDGGGGGGGVGGVGGLHALQLLKQHDPGSRDAATHHHAQLEGLSGVVGRVLRKLFRRRRRGVHCVRGDVRPPLPAATQLKALIEAGTLICRQNEPDPHHGFHQDVPVPGVARQAPQVLPEVPPPRQIVVKGGRGQLDHPAAPVVARQLDLLRGGRGFGEGARAQRVGLGVDGWLGRVLK